MCASQILDDGRVTDTQGRTVSFKNTVIIMTSNLGSSEIFDQLSGEEAKATKAQPEVSMCVFFLSVCVGMRVCVCLARRFSTCRIQAFCLMCVYAFIPVYVSMSTSVYNVHVWFFTGGR